MKLKNPPQYSVFKGSAFALNQGIISDSVGHVLFAFKKLARIYLENNTKDQNEGLITTPNNTLINFKTGEAHNIDCFYNLLVSKSQYSYQWLLANGDPDTKNTRIPIPSINVYKIQINAGTIASPILINTLEVRVKDPISLIGINSAPAVPFYSIAITKSEVDNLVTVINGDSAYLPDKLSHFDFASTPTPIKNDGYRDCYKVELNIIGTKKNKTPYTIPTDITIYSVDGQNWFSHAYATEVFNGNSASNNISLIDGYVWDNQVVPQTVPVYVNPLVGMLYDKLYDKANNAGIIPEANDLPTPGTNKGNRLLNGEIRDAIYQGDIEQVTFEMAFRLPFYMERPKDTPYTKDSNGVWNNPYYTKFDAWLGYANGIRGAVNLTDLNEVGKKTTDYGSSYHDYNTQFYNLMGLQKRDALISNNIPAYMAQNYEYENPYNNFKKYAVIPVGRYHRGSALNLSDLVAATPQVINSNSQSQLENGTIDYVAVSDGTYLINNKSVQINGGYLFKDPSDNQYYIYHFSHYNDNNSGITFGFGYDIGQYPDYQELKNYTGWTGNNAIIGGTLDDTIIQQSLGKTKLSAMKLYYPFYDLVWKKHAVEYTTAVKNTPSKMEKKMGTGIILIGKGKRYFSNGNKTKDLYLRIFQSTFGYFYDANQPQFLNEVEKVVFLSLSWNMGNGSLYPFQKKSIKDPNDPTKRIWVDDLYYQGIAKRAIHSFNTHDYRYLKYSVNKSGISHKQKIINLLNIYDINKYFGNV